MCFLLHHRRSTCTDEPIHTSLKIMKTSCIPLLLTTLPIVSSFVGQLGQRHQIVSFRSSSNQSDFDRPATFLDEDSDDGDINVTFLDEKDYDDKESAPKGQGRKRWENLNPNVKERLIARGQAKAIANKKKREPARDKKRRMFDFATILLQR